MAFNLAEFAKLEQNPIRAGVMANLLRKSSLLELMPFQNVDSLRSTATKWQTLPTMSHRYINGGYSPNEGSFGQVTEALYGFGGEIRFDRVFDKLKNTIVDPKTEVLLQKTTAMALTFNDYVVNGDHAVDPLGPEGLKKRIAGMVSRQTVNAQGSTDALDPTASAANARKFLDKWEEAHYKAGGGANSANAILMNEGMSYGFARVLRYLNVSGGPLVSMVQDMFDREVMAYKGARFVDVGLKVDQSTEIITVTEDPGDGGNDATSVYFLPFNIEQGIMGIQLSEPEIYDPLTGGEMEALPATMMRIDWWYGLAGFGSYGPTRLKQIKDPASWT